MHVFISRKFLQISGFLVSCKQKRNLKVQKTLIHSRFLLLLPFSCSHLENFALSIFWGYFVSDNTKGQPDNIICTVLYIYSYFFNSAHPPSKFCFQLLYHGNVRCLQALNLSLIKPPVVLILSITILIYLPEEPDKDMFHYYE